MTSKEIRRFPNYVALNIRSSYFSQLIVRLSFLRSTMIRGDELKEQCAAASAGPNSVPPASSVFRDPATYLAVNRINEAILNRTLQSGSNQLWGQWGPYRHLLFGGNPVPIFYDYRQMFSGAFTPGFVNSAQGTVYPTNAAAWPSTPSVEYQQISETTVVKLDEATVEKVEEIPLSMEISQSNSLPCEVAGLQRVWIPAHGKNKIEQNGAATSRKSNPGSFTLCSYNVLCQTTLHATGHLYVHCPLKYLNWNYRWQLLQKEFAALDADVFCLQEVEECYYESHYLQYFKMKGYDGLFKRRLGSKPDGCATFWRCRKFNATYGYTMDFKIANSILDRDNVALITVLETVSPVPGVQRGAGNGHKVIIANTHLLFNPGRGDIKLCQAAMLLARIQKISSSSKSNDGVIVCGDFNAAPFCPLYNFLIEGSLHYVGLRKGDVSGQQKRAGPPLKYPLLPAATGVDEASCTLKESTAVAEPGCLGHRMNLVSAYGHRSATGQPEVSSIHSKDCCNVDYILYRVKWKKVGWVQRDSELPSCSANSPKVDLVVQEMAEERLRCEAVLSLPDRQELKRKVGNLPNEFCASDHLPLMAMFAFV